MSLCSLQRRHSWGYALSSLRLRHSKPSWQTNDFDDAWAGCNENAGYALSFIHFRAVGGFVTRCWPTKPKASQVSQKLDFGRSLGSALFLEVTASIREWSAGLIPEQRPVMFLPDWKASPVGIAKTIVGWPMCWGVGIVYCLFSLLYYVIWWLLPFETPRNYISSVTTYTGFPITLKQSSSRKQFRNYQSVFGLKIRQQQRS